MCLSNLLSPSQKFVLWSYPDTFSCMNFYLYLSILCFIFVISSCTFENYNFGLFIVGIYIFTYMYINRCNKLIFMCWMNLAFPGWTLLVYDILLFLCVADCEFCRYFYFVSALSWWVILTNFISTSLLDLFRILPLQMSRKALLFFFSLSPGRICVEFVLFHL